MSRHREDLTGGLFLDGAELAAIADVVKRWEKEPELVAKWARRMAMTTALVMEKVIAKASGRRAAQDISVAADRLAKMIDAMAKSGVFTQNQPPPVPSAALPRKSPGGSTADEPNWDPEGE